MTEHVLRASGVSVPGQPRDVLPPTDIELRSGSIRAVVGEPGHGHTALALALAGRLPSAGGTVELDGSTDPVALRRAVALVDVPGVSEPDEAVPVGTILGEELAMAGTSARRADVQLFAPDLDLRERTDAVPAAQRVELLLRAAALRPDVMFLVLTLPDRWGVEPAQWEPVAATLADQGLGVCVTVGATSRHLLTVPATSIGEVSEQ